MEPAREVLNLRAYRRNLRAPSRTCAQWPRGARRLALAAAEESAEDAAEQVAKTPLAGGRAGLGLRAACTAEHLA